jgi:hypothetical protein
MKISDINNLKNNDYIVLLPDIDYDIKDSVEYTFHNVISLNYELTKEDANTLVDFINNNESQLIIFDYSEFYRQILPYIRKNRKIKWIYKDNLAGITAGNVRATFTNLMEFCDRNIVDTIGCLDESTYEVLKNGGYNAKHILLDIPNTNLKVKKTNSIGIIGNDYNPNHNTYNQLSVLKMVDYSYVKMIKTMPSTDHFINFFDIKYKNVNTLEEVMKDNFINLYCNFTFTNYELILKSMDMGVPCLLGNTQIFDKYPKLKNYLVLDSDDDINEISYKIKNIKENKAEILEEYNKFRQKYIKESKVSIDKFLS